MIAAGGTGGHVYPALAVAEAALKQPDITFTFVGSVDGFERPLLQEANIPFEHYDEVRAGPLHGVSAVKAVKSALDLTRGTVQAFGLLRRRKPDVILLTGGWVGLPVALAGWVRRIPILIYLPDIEPGLTIRMLKRFASRIAVTTEDSRAFFPADKVIVTGYPIRAAIASASRADGLAVFNLDPARRTLLVFGGSRGARTINYAVFAIVPALIADGLQIVHVTGALDWDDLSSKRAELPPDVQTHYHLYPYLHHEMGAAFACADLVVCRAGASTLGELPYFGLPSILVPYPFAWRYQKVNADWLADRGAAVVLPDDQMRDGLLPAIRAILGDEARRESMAARARALARPDGAERIADALLALAEGAA